MPELERACLILAASAGSLDPKTGAGSPLGAGAMLESAGVTGVTAFDLFLPLLPLPLGFPVELALAVVPPPVLVLLVALALGIAGAEGDVERGVTVFSEEETLVAR